MAKQTKELTKAEEQIMQVIWKLDQAFIREIIKELPEPIPAYTTVATIVKILEKKGFVKHDAFGKSYRFFPAIKKSDYRGMLFKNIFKNYFNDSPEGLLSHFMKDSDLSIDEMDTLIKKMKDND
jgi:BlaI family transcriptional regulator, penicillinase repressor